MRDIGSAMRLPRVAGIVGAALLWASAGVGLAQEKEVLEGGKQAFSQYCGICHGLDGKGKGLVANVLTVPPTDLTQMAKQNNGEFPFWRLYRVCDGREVVKGHGTEDMPVWGTRFRAEAGSGPAAESQVRGRVLEILFYLQSIQEK